MCGHVCVPAWAVRPCTSWRWPLLDLMPLRPPPAKLSCLAQGLGLPWPHVCPRLIAWQHQSMAVLITCPKQCALSPRALRCGRIDHRSVGGSDTGADRLRI